MKYFQNIKNRGFSMVEVLTVVVIISILSSISYTAWRQYIKRARFTEAKVNLSMVFASQAQYKSTCGHYHPDLQTIGALPSGKLHYNIGASFDSSEDWGKCLANTNTNCSDCKRYFEDICVDNAGTVCDQASFETFNSTCTCYIKADHKVNKSDMETAPHTAQNYCGISKGVMKEQLCVLAASAINRDRTTSSEWDVWAINHLNIVKQTASPGN